MKNLTSFIFILTIFLFTSCVPSSPNKKRKSSSDNNSVKQNGGTTQDPNFGSGESLYWYSGSKVDGTITLNENLNTVIYMRGQELHNFLGVGSNFSFNYCLVASFSEASAKTHLKFRAVPISFNNITTGVNEKLLRIDIPETAINSSTCDAVGGNEPRYIDSLGNPGLNITDANSAFKLEDLCPTCSGIISSENISLYSAANNNISSTDIVPPESLVLSSLGLRVDVRNNSTQQTSSCTNSECVAKGFDCCSNGQCVNDGQVKPNASTEADYNQALADVGLNPNNFYNYPNVYFICSTNQTVEPTPTPLPDAAATAAAQLISDTADFNCLEGAKEDPASYANCAPGNDETSFKNIRSDVWARCGCEADPFPTEPDNPQCPDFGLSALRDVAGNITGIVCYTPPPITDPTPFQNLSLNLPIRSAPHRFFDSSGNNVDDVTTVINTIPAVVQEGEEFSYLDEVGKTDPISGSFNMNSILGQLKVDLSRAHPAKVINIELDQTYVIAAVSGYSTPCPQCADDSWFNNFSSHPQTSGGNGLQWTGYSTSRNSYQNNLTNGNYEDTIFGRACWLPPTMIPFSHKKDQNVQTQRQNRLATQAAYYVNGYQRDWFGFNKGALIGSFDGVRWFAIGNGRRVTSTSNKLFLAINAPFADLAEPSNLLVNIITDLGNNTAPNFDWDPSLLPNNPDQNQAASCQYNHQCNVDSDCVAKLGWEYVCSDTSRYKSKWPKFNSNADETADEEYSDAGFGTILQGNQPPGSAKRCVYRGAGAPCKQDYTANLNSLDSEQFTCAPNFYCSSLTSSDFNKEVVRTPNLLEAIIFGQEADILGRPKSYLKGDSSLTTEIRGNMEYNATIFTSQVGDWGICRPGKRISADPLVQHQNNDSSNRTDYVSQIAGCNSSVSGATRVDACPVFETAKDTGTDIGEYLRDTLTTTADKKSEQNMCGAESQKLQGTTKISTFEQIEAETIVSVNNILNPTLVQDACLRRPGSVCHTNLDCSPNFLHAEQASFYGLDYFGNTEAEKKFWQESLVCGQAQSQPFPTATDYFDYDITKNRCCREIGNDFTMYTEGNTTIIPDLGTDNTNLVTDRMAYTDPTADGRYSRYAVASPVRTGSAALASPVAETPRVTNALNPYAPKAFQWKTFNDTGKKTCCGGGWVRKFADGTNDWSNLNRLQMDVSKFSCLNYKNDLVFEKPDEVSDFNFNQDLNFVCRSPGDGGCIQSEIPIATAFEITYPSLNASVGSIDTTPIVPPVSGQPCEQSFTTEGPYAPRYYTNVGNEIFLATDQCRNYFHDSSSKYGVSLFLPTYIGARSDGGALVQTESNITSVEVRYMDQNGAEVRRAFLSNSGMGCHDGTNPILNLGPGLVADTNDGFYCLDVDLVTNSTQIHAVVNPDPPGTATWSYAGLVINYKSLQTSIYDHKSLPACDASAGAAGTTLCDNGMNPGNALYYLTKLSRLELLGVPQIFYEALYCNSNRSKIVGGIFDTTADTRAAFEAISIDYDPNVNSQTLEEIYTTDVTGADGALSITAIDETVGNHVNGQIAFQDKVSLPQIFSGHDFKCCIELGEKTPEAGKCCSGIASTTNNELTCRLPRGTNLNVYFNKFISSEGIGEDKPGGGLTEDDFIPATGEPRMNIAVNNKLIALGQAYCLSGSTRKGGAFGYFFGEPNNGSFIQINQTPEDSKRFSIVDSTNDIDPDNNSGFSQFQQGFRWDHQFYCD